VPSPAFFTRSLIRVASLQGRAVLEAIITGQFSVITKNGGKQLIGVAAGGKSFSYMVPIGLSLKDLMGLAEEALAEFDSMDSDEVDALLSTKPLRKTVSGF
jgi:hypothetical protein